MQPLGCRVADVCFVHWPVDPDVLATRLPHALSVATRDGVGWVSLLGMRTRPFAGPVALPGAFSQVTLRTYVETDGEPGVHFLRVDVDGRLVATVGRRLFGVPFRHADASVSVDGAAVRVRDCAPDGPALFDATVERRDDAGAVDPESLVGWLTDRDTYVLEDGRTGRVEHDPWRVAEPEVQVTANDVLAAEGLPDPEGEPLVRYSPGARFWLLDEGA